MTLFLICLGIACCIALFGMLNMPEEAMLFRCKSGQPDPELQKLDELQALATQLRRQAEQLQQQQQPKRPSLPG